MDLSKDVLAFARERRRMCDFYRNRCKDCALFLYDCDLGAGDDANDILVLNEVQKWHDAHPPKTYLMDFLEKFPNCEKDAEGFPMACRMSCRQYIYPLMSSRDCSGRDCSECWNEPMEGNP